MGKDEFLQTLRMSLTGKVTAQVVAENMAYYEDYINTQIRLGRTEESIMDQLGDPRLIAKTIVSTIEMEKERQENYYREEAKADEKAGNKGGFWSKLIRFNEWPWWGYMLIPVVVIAVILLILFILWILSLLLPIIAVTLVIGVMIVFFVKLVRELMR